MDPLIELHDLARDYNGRPAVRGISLAVPAGEVFGLLGPNEAGKSTTFKMLALLLQPSAGTARLGGFREAAEKLRRGDRTACFPAGSFPPALPFVAG